MLLLANRKGNSFTYSMRRSRVSKSTREMIDSLGERRDKYVFAAGLIPFQEAMDRFVRYEAHLSREFDRTLNQLEACNRCAGASLGHRRLT